MDTSAIIRTCYVQAYEAAAMQKLLTENPVPCCLAGLVASIKAVSSVISYFQHRSKIRFAKGEVIRFPLHYPVGTY